MQRAAAAAQAAGRVQLARRQQAQHEAAARAQIEARIRFLDEVMSRMDVGLRFYLDSRSGTLRILVTDRSGRVIRQVPPEYFMRATADIGAGGAARGLLFDEGA
jgi:uncharacterized FlaG/YvyC family protein